MILADHSTAAVCLAVAAFCVLPRCLEMNGLCMLFMSLVFRALEAVMIVDISVTESH